MVPAEKESGLHRIVVVGGGAAGLQLEVPQTEGDAGDNTLLEGLTVVLTGTLPELAAQGPGWSQGGPALLIIGAAVSRRVGQGGGP